MYSCKKLTIIGDVHGLYGKYFEICRNKEFTIQIGDTGYSNNLLVGNLDNNIHKFITGNHNSHDTDYSLPHCLGRFGSFEKNGIKFLFVSGGFSIDWKIREKHYWATGYKTFFDNEELNRAEQDECIDLYTKVKPDILLTHEPPRVISNLCGNPAVLRACGYNANSFTTSTSSFLDLLIEIHRPSLCVSGHMHVDFKKSINGTDFVVLPELGVLELSL